MSPCGEGVLAGDCSKPPSLHAASQQVPCVQRAAAQVQFHPESVATQYGIAVLQNFRDLTLQHRGLPAEPPLLHNLRGEELFQSNTQCVSIHHSVHHSHQLHTHDGQM